MNILIIVLSSPNSIVVELIFTDQTPACVLSLHASKSVLAERIGPPNDHMLADAIINLALAKGRPSERWESITSYHLTKDWAGLVAVIENKHTNR